MATFDEDMEERERIRKAVDEETEKERVRRTSIKLTDVVPPTAIDGKANAQEELLRKTAQRDADHAVDEERARRMSLDKHSSLNEQFSRERNKHDADRAAEEERRRRMEIDHRATAQEQMIRQKSIKEADHMVMVSGTSKCCV